MQFLLNIRAYFNTAVSYVCIVFMKLTLDINGHFTMCRQWEFMPIGTDTSMVRTRKGLHSSRLRSYPKTLDKAGKACHKETLKHIRNFRQLRQYKNYTSLSPGCKGLPGTNTLAYLASLSVTKKMKF
jgi:hypothetical protein